jgi:putative endonuclease
LLALPFLRPRSGGFHLLCVPVLSPARESERRLRSGGIVARGKLHRDSRETRSIVSADDELLFLSSRPKQPVFLFRAAFWRDGLRSGGIVAKLQLHSNHWESQPTVPVAPSSRDIPSSSVPESAAMAVYHVYVLCSSSGVLYTGVTNHLERRIAEHKQKLTPGFTQEYGVTRLVYLEPYGDIRNAIAREKQIKRWRREKKLALIRTLNPKFRDLS